jgi:hypothetical protein
MRERIIANQELVENCGFWRGSYISKCGKTNIYL